MHVLQSLVGSCTGSRGSAGQGWVRAAPQTGGAGAGEARAASGAARRGGRAGPHGAPEISVSPLDFSPKTVGLNA